MHAISYLKDENEYFSDFKYYVREIIKRVVRTNLTRVRNIIFNKNTEGKFFKFKCRV